MNDELASTETQRGDVAATRATVTFLKRCIAACEDGETGFTAAAADVRGPKLKELFETLALQRAEFADALEGVVRILDAPRGNGDDEAPPPRPSWASYRRKVESLDDRVVIEACVSAEDATLEVYEAPNRNARCPMPSMAAAIVDDQHDAIQRAHADLRAILAARA